MSCQAQVQSQNKTVEPKEKITKTDAEWKSQLTEMQYYVLRGKGTERPNTGLYNNHKEAGLYTCAACDNPLFYSNAKFDSHCGWPSYFEYATDSSVVETADNTHGMVRIEITCAKCDGHLGHVFNDGPPPTGLRYCINSASLGFKEE